MKDSNSFILISRSTALAGWCWRRRNWWPRRPSWSCLTARARPSACGAGPVPGGAGDGWGWLAAGTHLEALDEVG